MKKMLALIVAFIAMIALIMSKTLSNGIISGLKISACVIIPSLFPFLVITNFVILSSLSQVISAPISFLTKHLFKLPQEMGAVFLMSLIGGYPVGAKAIAALVNEKKLSKQDASRMLCFCVNAGPSFIISGIGVGVFFNMQIGIILMISQIFSSIIIGCIISFKSKINTITSRGKDMSIAEAFVKSVILSTTGVLNLCAFVVLFSGIIAVINTYVKSQTAITVISGLLEVTSGCIAASSLPRDLSIILVSMFISFGGLSIISQIISCFSERINFLPFIISRFAHAFLTAFIAFPIYKFFEEKIVSVAVSYPLPILYYDEKTAFGTFCLLGMCTALLFSINLTFFLRIKE